MIWKKIDSNQTNIFCQINFKSSKKIPTYLNVYNNWLIYIYYHKKIIN